MILLNNQKLNLKVLTNQKHFKLLNFNALTKTLKIQVKSLPEKGKANTEIEQNLSKIFSKNVSIIRRFKSNKKIVLMQETTEKELKDLIQKNL